MKIYIKDKSLTADVECLVKSLDLEIIEEEIEDLHFDYDKNGLSLVKAGLRQIGDFHKNIGRLKPNNLGGEMLIKAIKIKGRKDAVVFDMTAGLGDESFLIAGYGYQTYMFERDPYICALLSDCLKRSMAIDELKGVVGRMKLVEGDSVIKSKELDVQPDVVYLDVMFPERNKSALVKKKFQLLHELEKPCDNEEEMLQAALYLKPSKIVIKRPIKAKMLGNIKPSYSIEGKAIRYDCILVNGLK